MPLEIRIIQHSTLLENEIAAGRFGMVRAYSKQGIFGDDEENGGGGIGIVQSRRALK